MEAAIMRRFTALLTVSLFGALSLVGCSSSKKSSDTTAAATATAAAESTAAAASAETTAAGGGLVVPATAEGTPVAVAVGETSDTAMFMKLSSASVPAGKVTFTLTNEGKKPHEMVVLKTDTPLDQLAVGTDNKVSEDTTKGEIGETPIGKVATVTLDLPAGNYVLVCNIEKHYAMGMRAAFTVTP